MCSFNVSFVLHIYKVYFLFKISLNRIYCYKTLQLKFDKPNCNYNLQQKRSVSIYRPFLIKFGIIRIYPLHLPLYLPLTPYMDFLSAISSILWSARRESPLTREYERYPFIRSIFVRFLLPQTGQTSIFNSS